MSYTFVSYNVIFINLYIVSLKFQGGGLGLTVVKTSQYLFYLTVPILISLFLSYHPSPYGVNHLMPSSADWTTFQLNLQMAL